MFIKLLIIIILLNILLKFIKFESFKFYRKYKKGVWYYYEKNEKHKTYSKNIPKHLNRFWSQNIEDSKYVYFIKKEQY
jgi:hypothetical protein